MPTAYFVPVPGMVVAHVLEDAEHEVEHDPGVDAEPAHRHQQLRDGRQVGAAAAERRARQHHLVDAGAVAHHAEEAEERAADDVADRRATRIVSTRLSPRMMPSAPRTQLIGAMFAPAQIQNCCHGVDVAVRGAGSARCRARRAGRPPPARSCRCSMCLPSERRSPDSPPHGGTDGRRPAHRDRAPASTSTGVSTRRRSSGRTRSARDVAAGTRTRRRPPRARARSARRSTSTRCGRPERNGWQVSTKRQP